MFDGNMREQVDRVLEPMGEYLKNFGVTPDVVTITGIAMSTAAAIVIGAGNLWVGLLLMILTGVPDALDGAVAKAESLGFDAKGGLMERAERFIALGIGLFLGGFDDALLIGVLWIMFVLTAITAIQRFFKVWKQASALRPAVAKPAAQNRRRARDARRARREPLAQRWRNFQDRR